MNPKIPVQRHYEIDWLRHITVFLLITFHTARIFDIWEPFYAKTLKLVSH
jgi:glucan biosynthesis protein C